MTKPFRFGVQIGGIRSAADIASLARRIEELGYDTLAVPDHFDDNLAPWPTLLLAAQATERVRLLPLVICNDFQHPAVLAREAATVARLTDGRVDVGLGAGWMRSDYQITGIPLDAPATRVDRLAEAVAVYNGMFASEALDFDGVHYQVHQPPGTGIGVAGVRPPLLIGGGGRRVLTLAGREADIVGINANLRAGEVSLDMAGDMVEEMTDEKLSWVRDSAGARWPDLEINVLVYAVAVTDDRGAAAEGFAGGFGLTADRVLASPHFLIGTVGQIAETLQQRRERWGMNHIVIQGGLKQLAPVVERLAGT